MPRSFDAQLLKTRLRDPRFTARVVLGTLLALNVAGALILLKPWGGSPEDLRREMADLQRQLVAKQAQLERSKALVKNIEKARVEGDRFMDQYMLNRRSAYSTIVGELDRAGTEAGVKPKESQYAVEPVEGSDTLGTMTISANYEGAYASLTKFINALDRSPRFLLIESLQAAPQASGAVINLNLKLLAFVKGEPGEME